MLITRVTITENYLSVVETGYISPYPIVSIVTTIFFKIDLNKKYLYLYFYLKNIDKQYTNSSIHIVIINYL